MEATAEARGSFSGRMGFLLATAGSAVGLGNLWRFPYLTEQYGGGIFLFVYLVLLATFGVAMMITELAIGRRTGKSCFDALMDLNDKHPIIGWIAVLVPIIIVPYYCVIGGWVSRYFFGYATGGADQLASEGFFEGFMSMAVDGLVNTPVIWFLIYACLTIFIVVLGVKRGIEGVCKILMPALFVLLIAICIYMLTIPGIEEGLSYYLVPDFSKLSFKTVAGAMGQLFYSLSIAMGITITYGSYMRKKENIEKSAYTVAFTDAFVAFLAGFMVVPAVILFSDVGISSGPGLMFSTMPLVFQEMPAGEIVGTAFFALALFSALTSSMALMEAVVSVIRDRWHITRLKACALCGAIIVLVGLLSCTGYGPLSFIQPLGMCFLDFFDFLTNSILMPVVALITSILVGYVVSTRYVIDEVESSGCEFRTKNLYTFVIKYLSPVVMIIILAVGILSAMGVYTI